MPIVAVLVVGVGGFAVYRLHGEFGSTTAPPPRAGSRRIVPFNPKDVVFEVFGDRGR